MNAFEACLAEIMPDGIRCVGIETLQVNLGRRCNLACAHCHLDCSPRRDEMMGRRTMEAVVLAARNLETVLVDITGGEPILHPLFRTFVAALRDVGTQVQVRTNLAAFLEPNMRGMTEFLREKQVSVVGSLPCYLEENVRAQRGAGVYAKSIQALRNLNALGYGTEDGPPLYLVYNPGGSALPGGQPELEDAYREELRKRFGITFTGLFTITNMPLGRFRARLVRERRLGAYLETLKRAFNKDTLGDLMCRRQVCVDWDGRIYDCDFNLALGYTVDHGAANRIDAFDADALRCRRVVTDEHCFGCTAGSGSSCSGALTNTA